MARTTSNNCENIKNACIAAVDAAARKRAKTTGSPKRYFMPVVWLQLSRYEVNNFGSMVGLIYSTFNFLESV